jgi:hypothetical protein
MVSCQSTSNALPGPEAAQNDPPLTPAAKRALAEAEERRRVRSEAPPPAEVGGREGPDPVRYGDWERGGIASDF